MGFLYRALWMANELGVDYENVPIHFADGSAKTPEYLAVNPNGRIPAIDDNGSSLGIHGHQSLISPRSTAATCCRRQLRTRRRRSNGAFGR